MLLYLVYNLQTALFLSWVVFHWKAAVRNSKKQIVVIILLSYHRRVCSQILDTPAGGWDGKPIFVPCEKTMHGFEKSIAKRMYPHFIFVQTYMYRHLSSSPTRGRFYCILSDLLLDKSWWQVGFVPSPSRCVPSSLSRIDRVRRPHCSSIFIGWCCY